MAWVQSASSSKQQQSELWLKLRSEGFTQFTEPQGKQRQLCTGIHIAEL
jgi:hypothetical protein